MERSALEQDRNSCYTVRTLMDDAATIAVRDAIVREIGESLASLTKEITSGDLGDEALKNRKQAATALHDRARLYEGILSEALPALHAAITQAEIAATTAALQQLGA